MRFTLGDGLALLPKAKQSAVAYANAGKRIIYIERCSHTDEKVITGVCARLVISNFFNTILAFRRVLQKAFEEDKVQWLAWVKFKFYDHLAFFDRLLKYKPFRHII